MNRGTKSSSLWNVLDPDDPYDIKKSMIARLPDHPSKPMGQHLELVCLLQAAEIERLSDYLTEIKSKYKEMERRQLDRHSYEVQIKELAQKNISLNNLQKENERLKEFIRRQQIELEEMQKKNISSANLEATQAKYQRVLNELQISRAQNENAEKTISRQNIEIVEWRSRWEKAEQERLTFTSQFQIQWREKLNLEIKTIKERAEERVDRLQVEARQLKETIDNKNHEIQVLSAQREQLVKENRLLEEKNRNKGNIEEAINEKNRQIQRLNVIINERTAKLEQATASNQKIGGELNIIEERYRNVQKERQRLLIKIKQYQVLKLRNDNLERLEEKVAMMSMEIQRLNGLNAARARQCADANGQIQRLKFQLRNNQGSKEQLERERQRISKLENQLELLRVVENRAKIATAELERVSSALNSKNEEVYTLQQRLNAAQVSNIELTTLTKQKVRLEQQLQISMQKIENMKNTINANQMSALDLAKLSKERSALEQQLQAARAELRNYKTITESQIGTLKMQNQRIRQDLDHNSVSRGEYEKYKIETERLRAEIERIRSESINIRKIFEEQKINTLKIESQRNSLLSQNQNMLNELLLLKKEIEGLKVMGKTFEQKQKLLQSKQFQIINLQRVNNNLGLQLQDLKSRNVKLQGSVESIYNEIERLHTVLSTKVNQNQKLLRDASQLEEKCRFYETKLANTASERQYYEKQIIKFKQEIQNTSKLSNQTSRDLMNRINDFLIEKEKTDKVLIQKQKLISEYSKEKENLQRKLVDIQREFAIKISIEEQLRKERDQIRIQREKYYEQLRIKETTLIQLQTVIREKENQGKDSESKVKVWQSRVTEWESRLKDAQRGIQIRQQETDRYKRENERLNVQIQRFSQDAQRSRQIKQQEIEKYKRENERLNAQIQRFSQDGERSRQIKQQEIEKYKRENERLNSQIQRFSQELQEIVRQRQTIINENNQLKRRIEQLMKDQKSKFAEDQLRNQLKMAQQALFRERKQSQNLRNNCRVFEQNLNRQGKQLQSLRQNIKEYQMKIVHIETTQTRILEDRIKDYDKKLQERENLIIGLQRQKKQMESQLGSVVARDQDSLNNLHKYEEKISLLSIEIERLNIKLEEKARQCREKDAFIQNFGSRTNFPDKETTEKMRQYQSKLSFYASQIDKFNAIIKEKDRQIIDKNNAIQSLTIKINQSSNSLGQQSQATLSRYKIEITNLKTALQEFENINMHTIAERDQLFKVSHELKDQLDQHKLRSSELERQLRGELNYRLEENRKFGEELGLLKKKEQSLLLKIQEYERTFNSRNEDRQLKGRIGQLEGQVQSYQRQINELKILITNKQQQLNQLMIINQQLNTKIGQSSSYSRDEFSRITTKVRELTLLIQSKDEQIIEWDQKYSSLYAAYEQLYHNYQITKTEYDVTQANIRSIEAKLFKIGEDYEALASVLRARQQQIYDLKIRFKSDGDLYEKNLMLSKQIDRLNEVNKRLQLQISELRLTLTDNVSLQKRIEEQLGLLVVLFAEIESLRSRLINSEQQCEEVRRSSIAPFRVDRRM